MLSEKTYKNRKIIFGVCAYSLYLFGLYAVTNSWLTAEDDDCCYQQQYEEAMAVNLNNKRDFYEKQGSIIWDVPVEKKVIAFTFDDGPTAKFTPAILDLLKKYQAKATFFALGSCVESYPSLAKRIVAEGHEIGNHTLTHPNLRQTSQAKLRKEIAQTSEIIKNATGYVTTLFRPVGGVYNDNIVKTVLDSNHKLILWSWDQDTLDWTHPNKNKIASKILKNASGGDIVLLHDSQLETVQALETVLPKLIQEGYEFVTVTELLALR